MRFAKRKLADIPCCYAVAGARINGRRKLIFAAEADGPCVAIDAGDLSAETVWDHPGGTMAIVQPAGSDGEFLAIQRFYPGFNGKDAGIVRAARTEGVASGKAGAWRFAPIAALPYVHRFDVFVHGGVRYLLCCTVCSEKGAIDDWSSPGKLYGAVLPNEPGAPVELSEIAGGMTRNHGYCRVQTSEGPAALTSCDQGVFEVRPPYKRGSSWTVDRVMDRPVSDIALCDIDGDGRQELAAIEPFHGDAFVLYRRGPAGFERFYEYPRPLAFAHVVWGGKLRGRGVFLGGCRGAGRDLFALSFQDGRVSSQLIESGAGPSNVAVLSGGASDLVAVANREIGEAAVFAVED